MWELSCGCCGTLLEAEICSEEEPPAHDIHLGVTSDEPGEAF